MEHYRIDAWVLATQSWQALRIIIPQGSQILISDVICIQIHV